MIQQRTIDKYINKRFGRLTVTSFSRQVGVKQYYFNVRCDCGTEKEARLSCLQQGTAKSCGCLGKERRAAANTGNTRSRKKFGESSFNTLLAGYRRHAMLRNIPFELTPDEFRELTSGDCFYCGTKPKFVKRLWKGYGEYPYNGVDRVDNDKGYSIDNCVPACRPCNSKKNGITRDMVYKLYHRLFTQDSPSTSSSRQSSVSSGHGIQFHRLDSNASVHGTRP